MKNQTCLFPKNQIRITLSVIFSCCYLFSNAQYWDGSTSVQTTASSPTAKVGIGIASPAASIHIVNNQTPGGNTEPGLKIENFVTIQGSGWPFGFNTNIMEVWNEQTYVPFVVIPQMPFVIDGLGHVGINTPQPAYDFDVTGTIHGTTAEIDNTVRVGNAIVIGTWNATEKLNINGNMAFDPSQGSGIWRSIYGNTDNGGVGIHSGTGSADGSSIELYGNAAGSPGEMHFVANGTTGNGFIFYNYDASANHWAGLMNIRKDGKVIIGNINAPGDYQLYVEKGILTEKVKVALSNDPTNWSDFVFHKDYKLRPLNELESYINKNKHLPEIPSTEEVHKEGLDLAAMDAKLLQKVEELTLYAIQQQKQIQEQQQKYDALQKEIEVLKKKK